MLYNKNMKLESFIQIAKISQKKLKDLGFAAEHIYLVDYSTPSIVFISEKYNKLDLYDRIRLSSKTRNGPLKYDFHIIGTRHITLHESSINKEKLYNAIKIYGRTPLILNEVEFASKQDFIFNTQKPKQEQRINQ
jgi:hypothetical protein